MSKQIQKYLAENINTDLHTQLLYKHCTDTCLSTDEWLKQIDMKSVIGVVLLDFSTASDIIDYELLLMKLSVYRFKDSAIDLLKGYLVNVLCSMAPFQILRHFTVEFLREAGYRLSSLLYFVKMICYMH